MKTLYIIGNGFDLGHGLETKYQHFALFLKRNNSDLFDLMVKYYYLTDLDEEDQENSLRDELWGDFENKLAEMDFEELLQDFMDYIESPASENFRDRDNHVFDQQVSAMIDRLTKELYKEFKEFILEVKFQEEPQGLIRLEGDSAFLSFNYTDTLERYYGVERKHITYIHGRAKTDGERTILGHGIDPEEFTDKRPTPPSGVSEEQLNEWYEEQSSGYDYAYDQGRGTAIGYFRTAHKSTSEIITKNQPFFESIAGVEKIFVLGHSLSEVDLPYFEKVISATSKPKWIVSSRDASDQSARIATLVALGVDNDDIAFTTIEELRPEQTKLF